MQPTTTVKPPGPRGVQNVPLNFDGKYVIVPIALAHFAAFGFTNTSMLTYYISRLHRQPLRGNDRHFALLATVGK